MMNFQKYIFYSGVAAIFCYLAFLLLLLLLSLLAYDQESLYILIPLAIYFIVSGVLFSYTLLSAITPFWLFAVILMQILSGIAAFYGAAIIELNIFLHYIDETGARIAVMIYGILTSFNYLIFLLIPRKDKVSIEQNHEP